MGIRGSETAAWRTRQRAALGASCGVAAGSAGASRRLCLYEVPLACFRPETRYRVAWLPPAMKLMLVDIFFFERSI